MGAAIEHDLFAGVSATVDIAVQRWPASFVQALTAPAQIIQGATATFN
ncbi:MAG: hypothetical protein R2932_43010 [Caldilineaceae bacterium]